MLTISLPHASASPRERLGPSGWKANRSGGGGQEYAVQPDDRVVGDRAGLVRLDEPSAEGGRPSVDVGDRSQALERVEQAGRGRVDGRSVRNCCLPVHRVLL